MPELDYLAGLRRESIRFHQCLSIADPAAPVPSCPGWTAGDLLWHLTEVQSFWATIVRDRLQSPADQPGVRPDVDYPDLLAGFVVTSNALLQALAETPDETAVWTWSDDQTVGFIRRRQAHEALIHRLDAELTIGEVSPLEPSMAGDGVDEVLTVMYGGYPEWAAFEATPGTGRVISSDTDASWDFSLGRFSGTSPTSGNEYDDPTIVVSPRGLSGEPAFTVSGTASELDAWLWGRRAFAEPTIVGAPALAETFLAMIATGVQ